MRTCRDEMGRYRKCGGLKRGLSGLDDTKDFLVVGSAVVVLALLFGRLGRA